MVGKTVRVTSPSRSRHLSVKVSIRCEMLPSARRSSLNRFGPSPRVLTTSTVHLSPTRASTSLPARQSSGTCRLLGISDVPSCRRRLGLYLEHVPPGLNQGDSRGAKDGRVYWHCFAFGRLGDAEGLFWGDAGTSDCGGRKWSFTARGGRGVCG